MNDVIKKITDFWMDSPFLEKFKKIGEWFEKEIKTEIQVGEINDGKQCI